MENTPTANKRKIIFIIAGAIIIVGVAAIFLHGNYPAENNSEPIIQASSTTSDADFDDADTSNVGIINVAPVEDQGKTTKKTKSEGKTNDDTQAITQNNTSSLAAGIVMGKNSDVGISDSSLATSDAIPYSASTSSPASSCSFPKNNSASPHSVIFNEVAWMGSPSSSLVNSLDASKEEWIELKNISANDVSLSGWELSDSAGTIKIHFTADDHIAPGGFFLVANASTIFSSGITPDKTYSGSLRNAGDILALVNASCDTMDFLDASENGWPAGNNSTKQTMERDVDTIGWHTSTNAGGTPGKENSIAVPPIVKIVASSTPYQLTISLEGDGAGSITSSPSGMVCATTCSGTYPYGSQITLNAVPGKNATFSGWSGSCYGENPCVITLANGISLAATFHITIIASTSSISDSLEFSTSTASSSSNIAPSLSTATSSGHILIFAVQIAGASSTNDFVKLYNPTNATIDISGWKLHKKSQTGTDYSLRTFSANTLVPAGSYFVWANSINGFSESINANVSSTETLSSDNSVALLGSDGSVVDAVAWGTGTDQYGEGSPYPTNPLANQILTRSFSSGAISDTKNNASDFTVQ